MFERITKRLHPAGWPEPVDVRELTADDVLPMFMNGKPDAQHVQRVMVHRATYTVSGERIFETPEAVGQVPTRFVAGLLQLTTEVMRLNTPAVELEPEAGPT
jgi:hypothetical protein